MKDVSILICTRNRCVDLRETLDSISLTVVPPDLDVEVIVVNNDSNDDTESVIRQSSFQGKPIVGVREPRRGLDFARNAGVDAAQGKVILLTDDDVRVPALWIDPMCRPILNNLADAVAGGIEMGDHLRREWMEGDILVWRRIVNDPQEGEIPPLIGANSAYARAVFERVPKFDEELDAGRLGLCGDILFSDQLRQAGFRIVSAISKTAVVHHFSPDRLSRASLIKRSIDQGRSDAYLAYHWTHSEPSFLRLRVAYRAFCLFLLRLKHILRKPSDEGLSSAESFAITRLEAYRGLLVECRRPRQYTRYGLVKNPQDAAQF